MLSLIFTLALIGLVVYLIITYIPLPPVFRTVITIIAVVFCIMILMSAFGVMDVPVPHLR